MRLGDLGLLSDGLVGYFSEDDPASSFQAEDDAANLSLTLAAAPQRVTLIVDPRAPVHATTGALPVQSMAIGPDQYAAALPALQFSFLVNPVVDHAPPGAIAVPVPAEAGASSWRWLERSGAGGWRSIDSPAAPRSLAGLDVGPRRIVEGWLAINPDRRRRSNDAGAARFRRYTHQPRRPGRSERDCHAPDRVRG